MQKRKKKTEVSQSEHTMQRTASTRGYTSYLSFPLSDPMATMAMSSSGCLAMPSPAPCWRQMTSLADRGLEAVNPAYSVTHLGGHTELPIFTITLERPRTRQTVHGSLSTARRASSGFWTTCLLRPATLGMQRYPEATSSRFRLVAIVPTETTISLGCPQMPLPQ